MQARSGRHALLPFAAVCSWLALQGQASAQLSLPGLGSPEAASTADAGQASEANDKRIPTVAIFDRALEADATVRAARKLLGANEYERIRRELPRLEEEMTDLARTSEASLAGSRQHELHDLLLLWDGLYDRLKRWQRTLKQRMQALEAQQTQVAALDKTWKLTLKALEIDDNIPRVVLAETRQVIAALDEIDQLLGTRAGNLFELQQQLRHDEETLVAQLERTRRATEADGGRLAQKTGYPIWEVLRRLFFVADGLPPLRAHGGQVTRGVEAFWRQYRGRLPLDACALIAFLSAALLLARRARARSLASGQAPSPLLSAPLAAALLIALVFARALYPRSMNAMLDLFGLVSLAPLLRLLPALVKSKGMVGPLGLLIGVFALHRSLPLLHLESPWYELCLLLVGTLIWAASYWIARSRAALPNALETSLDRAVSLFIRATLIGLSLALLAGLLGYYALLTFLIDGFAGSAYWLLLSIAFTRALLAFLEAGLQWRYIRTLASMQLHGDLIRGRAETAARWSGVGLWCVVTLYSFGLTGQALDWLSGLLDTSAHVGSWSASLGGVARFALTMYLATKLASLLAFILEQDVLPRLALARGLPPTISRLSRYTVLAFGFLFAVGAAGVDMSHVAMLASALSVGIGFGLQNVVNNFVSGLILIFERPIRVGDVVQLGDLQGEVRSIGIRASTLRTAQGAEVIMPNANLISNQVTNWTLSDIKRRIEVPIGVAYGTDPARAIALIQDAVAGVDAIERFPAPACIFTGLGASSLDFELRLWVQRLDDWPNVRSAVLVAVYGALSEAGIEIPFPQRDLHLRSVDPTLAQLLRAPKRDAALAEQG